METGTFSIALTPEEAAITEAMAFDPLVFRADHQAFLKNADLAHDLTSSLLARNAIPEQRLRYFTDAEYNPGGRGKSRKESFERNMPTGDGLFRHPHFLKYLRYFIHGASLPPSAEVAFTRAAQDCGPFSSGDMAPLSSTARQLARTHRLAPKAAADEFFKLCLDLGMSAGYAGSIRSSVQQLKAPR